VSRASLPAIALGRLLVQSSAGSSPAGSTCAYWKAAINPSEITGQAPEKAAADALDTYPEAVPFTSHRPQLWAGGLIIFTGLALIALSGCFLVGVLEALNRTEAHELQDRGSLVTLLRTLYALSLFCFGAGVVLIGIGFRGLYRILRK
jgi:hypothetical protein